MLIAPLDWGLGHTSRCIPIVAYLREKGCQVTFAGNEVQRAYIEETFEGIETIHLEGYNVHYGTGQTDLKWSILLQSAGILKSIKKEHEWLQELLRKRQFEAIISDNRYGLYHPEVHSVVITHQLQIQQPMGLLAGNVLRRLHYRRLNHFNECWVPDASETPNLSGALGHPNTRPPHTRYIGCLSQHSANTNTNSEHGPILILLSGPEPHRSILSDILWQQASIHDEPIVFVEGSGAAKRSHVPPHIQHYGLLAGAELSNVLHAAKIVIARSGYSTVMDLAALGKKAILIPTPGQTEQEYLGKYLQEAGLFYCHKQRGFELKKGLESALRLSYKKTDFSSLFHLHEAALDSLLNKAGR